MNEILPLDSSLPWLWIIEYLAGFKQVDTNILNDLIERASDLPGDPGKNARERIALRCLEKLFDPVLRLAGGVTPASRVRFDLSQSCEDVLQCILQESSVSDLKNPRPELLKWDLSPFLTHKRATLPKCALEELKDTILSGTHSYAAALKEISGLVSNNEPDGVTVCDDHHNALTSRLFESSSNAQTVPAKSNVVPLILENGNRILQHDLCLKNLLSSKRVRSELAAEDLADVNNGNKDSLFGHDSLHLNAKKLKQGCQGSTHTNPSVGQISNPLLLEDACGRFRVAEVDCSALCKESHVGEHCNDDHIGNGHDTNNICEIGDESVQFVTVDETHNGEPLSGALLMKTQQQISVEEAHGKGGQSSNSKLRPPQIVSTGGMAQNGSNHCEARADFYHPFEDEMLSYYDKFREEGIDMAMKKSHFLSSQGTSSQDRLGSAGCSKQNLCVKCNKVGQMLLCSTSGCPLVVHESCLGSQARFDDKGNFCCPFCVYSLSISEYLEANKKDRLARKKLSAFIHALEHCSMKHIEGHRKEQNPTNRNGEDANCQFQRGLVDKQQSGPSMSFRDNDTPCVGDEANLLRIQESGNLKEKEQNTRSENRQDLSCQCQSCVADKQQAGSSTSCRYIRTQSMKDVANCIRMQENGHLKDREQNTRSQNRVFDCHFQRNLANEQQSGPSISCIDVNKPSMENKSNVCSRTVSIAIIGKEGKEKVAKENLSEREPEKQGAQLSDSLDYNIDNASSEKTETTHVVNHREDEERIQKEVLQQHITNPDQQPVVLDCDGEDTSDTESDEFISLTSISCRDVNTPCLEDETNVHSRTLCIPTLGKKSKEEVVKESLSEREAERLGAQPFSDPDYNSDNPSSRNTKTPHLNQMQAEAGILGIPKEVLQQHRTNPDQQPIVLNFDGEDTSDTENDEVIKLNYSIRFRRQQRKCTYLAVPQLRRKKVPWTIEEEQMLREGVGKFSSTAGGNIPWKEILDRGSSVFLNCRTSVDLKDKWRNMCKGSPKPK